MFKRNVVRLRPLTQWQDFITVELARKLGEEGKHSITLPLPPQTLAQLDLSPQFAINLFLKFLLFQSGLSERGLAEKSALALGVVSEILGLLKANNLVAAVKREGGNPFETQFELTPLGMERAREAFYYNRYVGPAPVSLESYVASLEALPECRISGKTALQEALQGIVIEQELLDDLLSAAAIPGSLLIHGESGNGKTMLAGALLELLRGVCAIPRAIEVNEHCVALFDPSIHRPVSLQTSYDLRWVPIHRPKVSFSEALPPETLEFHYDELHHHYEAPVQLKANGGIIFVDDYAGENAFQQNCLGKILSPLSQGKGHFFFPNGWVREIPFRAFLILTCQRPLERAFSASQLQKIESKVAVSPPSAADYSKIFHMECDKAGLICPPQLVEKLLRSCYSRTRRPLAAAHPRLLLSRVLRHCATQKIKPTLNEELLRRACRQYFGR